MAKNGSSRLPRATKKRRAAPLRSFCSKVAIFCSVALVVTPILLIEFFVGQEYSKDMTFGRMPFLSDSYYGDKKVRNGILSKTERKNLIDVTGASDPKLARGVSGLPFKDTPSLIKARRGRVKCDVPVDNSIMTYWNDPQGKLDLNFVSPFASSSNHEEEYFLTFEPDSGGWNNMRMSLETIIVFAAATGRTLVMPPKSPLYLLGRGVDNARSFGDFFPLEDEELNKRVKIISMKKFMKKKAPKLIPEIKSYSSEQLQQLNNISEKCAHLAKSDINCQMLYDLLRKYGMQPNINTDTECLIFDQNKFEGKKPNTNTADAVQRFCGKKRTPVYYTKELADPQWLHWDASQHKNHHRLLLHFYTFMFFTDSVVDNYYKRFVRDFLHYKDIVYCAAWKIIKALNEESRQTNVPWSSLHVRRGDLQYKKVRISAQEWYENLKEIWKPNEILYFATDEKDKAFFQPFSEEHNFNIKFLDDYWDLAGLDKVDSSHLGMIDTIVASHGRTFAGTWFSTFTGYITRMRGYLGKSTKDSWYGYLKRKTTMQEWAFPDGNYYAREWPTGWVGIDGDEYADRELDTQNNENIKEVESSGQGEKKLSSISIKDFSSDIGFNEKPVARGVAGRPIEQTPALKGASRAHIECDVNVDSLAYWNNPQGSHDRDYRSPFAVDKDRVKYLSFSSDHGGWNNVRMSLENIFIIAATTGRTLVLPPKENLYLLHHDKDNRHRGFADFFPLYSAEFQERVKVISFQEFVEREGGADGRLPIPHHLRKGVLGAADHCDKRKKSKHACDPVHDYLGLVGVSPTPRAKDHCLVFDEDVFEGRSISHHNKKHIHKACDERKIAYWESDLSDPVLIHLRAGEKEYRLLTHFYGFLYFTNPKTDNYYKRFVRDFLHYNDQIYCAAGKIVKALQVEGTQRGFKVDSEGSGGFSAMHIRRGDFQYKKVKISASEWYENTKEIWKPKELLYIATDEKDKTSLNDIAVHHDLRFLDDYLDIAGLGNLDPNYFGMIDTIVSSRARAFAGTWFSTFSGYINRMRGYHGMTMMDSWYSFLDKKEAVQQWVTPTTMVYAYEWPDGWIGIDGDVWPQKKIF